METDIESVESTFDEIETALAGDGAQSTLVGCKTFELQMETDDESVESTFDDNEAASAGHGAQFTVLEGKTLELQMERDDESVESSFDEIETPWVGDGGAADDRDFSLFDSGLDDFNACEPTFEVTVLNRSMNAGFERRELMTSVICDVVSEFLGGVSEVLPALRLDIVFYYEHR